jgi:Family of unknown function (DUF5990)
MSSELPLRITVVRPPRDVAIQVQRGRDGLLPATHVTKEALSFDLNVRLGDPKPGAGLRFLGEFAQGPPSGRFIYVNSGKRAGERDSCWDRRAKVSLLDIKAAQVKAVSGQPGTRLEARIAGTARDGGPMCASVPLLDGGWLIVDESP